MESKDVIGKVKEMFNLETDLPWMEKQISRIHTKDNKHLDFKTLLENLDEASVRSRKAFIDDVGKACFCQNSETGEANSDFNPKCGWV